MASDKHDLTPEEKLLKVIQQSRGRDDKEPKPGEASVPSPAASASASSPAPAKPVTPSPAPTPPRPPVQPAPAEKPAAVPKEAPTPAASDRKLKIATPPPAAAESKAAAALAPHADGTEPAAGGPAAPPAPQASVAVQRALRLVAAAAERLSIVKVNRVLAAVILILLALTVYQVGFARPAVLLDVAIAPAVEPSPGGAPPAVSIPPLDEYASLRNPFAPRGAKPSTSTNTPIHVASATDFKLIGVSWDPASPDESEAILRSESRRQTYFVRQGQSIADADVSVIKVERERVLLRQSGKEIEVK